MLRRHKETMGDHALKWSLVILAIGSIIAMLYLNWKLNVEDPKAEYHPKITMQYP